MRDLYGVALAAMFTLLLMVLPMRMQSVAQQGQRQTVTAQEAQQIEQAAEGYVKAYSTQLLGATSATQSAAVTVTMLVNTGYLNQGTAAVNPYNQTWQVEVMQPTPGQLQAFVTTTGGAPLDDNVASNIVQKIGAAGGWYPQDKAGIYPTKTIVGAAWSVPLGNWPLTAGALAAYVNLSEDTNSDYLYRNAVPGDPDDNTMHTPLIMADVETAGAACSTTGAISQDGTGALVSCQAGLWTEVSGSWKQPVATYTALPASGNSSGDVRLTEDTDRAFAWTGSTWQALAVDQNGNLSVPNTITAGNGNVQLSSASFGSFLTMNSNTGENYSFVSQDNYMTLYDGSTGQSVWKANNSGEWDSDAGGFCFAGANNYSADCSSGWGFQPRYGNGWAMVTSVGGGLNAQAGSSLGSIHANDYYDRATGWWFSSLVSSVNSLSNDYSSQQGQINNLNGDYSYQQTEITSLQNQLHGQYLGSFGPAQGTLSGSSGGYLSVGGAGNGMYLPGARLLVIVTGIVGGSTNAEGANWGGLNEPCNNQQVGSSILSYVNGIIVGDIALSKTPSANYSTNVTTENTTSFMVPAGSSFSIQLNSGCGEFKGTIWEM